MREGLLTALRFAAAAIAGYAVIAVGTTLTFEVLLGGIGYYESSPGELAAATLGALLSGLAGGLVAALIGGRRPLAHALGVLVFLFLDTGYVLTSGISSDPLWFDLFAAGGLIAATVLGGWLRKTSLERYTMPPAIAPPVAVTELSRIWLVCRYSLSTSPRLRFVALRTSISDRTTSSLDEPP